MYVKADYFVQCAVSGDCIAQGCTLDDAREVAAESRFGGIVIDSQTGDEVE